MKIFIILLRNENGKKNKSEIMNSITYENKRYRKVERFLSTGFLELDDIQSYFPCAVAETNDINVNKWTTVKLENRLVEVTNRDPECLEGKLQLDETGSDVVSLHMKCTPILEPLCICQKDYLGFTQHHWLASDKRRVSNSINKVNSANNTAYTDTTCSILFVCC